MNDEREALGREIEGLYLKCLRLGISRSPPWPAGWEVGMEVTEAIMREYIEELKDAIATETPDIKGAEFGRWLADLMEGKTHP